MEGKMPTIERSPEAYEAILEIKKEIARLASIQRETRLKKRQKSISNRVKISVLHRLYLKIRNKPYEDVHRIREGWEWAAKRYEREFYDKFKLDVIFGD
jgi:hypothetical protein